MRRAAIRIAVLPLLSGALVCLSFPKWNLEWLAWAALIPLLVSALEAASSKEAFAAGWVAGCSAFCGVLYWLVPTFRAAHVPVLLGAGAVFALAAYIGLYYGTFAALSRWFFRRHPETPALVFSAALWAALEWLRDHFATGFPWGTLGYTQWLHPSVLQIAHIAGVYGVSSTLVLANLVVARLLLRRRLELLSVALVLIWASCCIRAYDGRWRPGPERTVRIAVLQGNIDQYKKWSREYVREILDSYGGLAREAESDPETALIVWPETALPGWVPQDPEILHWMQALARETGKPHLVGAVTQDGNKSYNSAFLFGPDGAILDRYDKIHLVPFGEFVPLQSWLGRWISVLNDLGGFDAGPKDQLIEAPGAALGVTICYEAIFPEIARRETAAGAQVLVNLTNDGWYLDTAAPEQHFSMSVLRAVENGRWLVRAANTGISGVIRPDGAVALRTRLNERAQFAADVAPENGKTFYARHGDVFAAACGAAVLCAVLIPFIFKESQNENRQ